MRIIFFGSSDFGLPALKALLAAGHEIPCVVTQPDRKKGRGLGLGKTVIKQFAEDKNIPVYQPEKINTPESAAVLKKSAPDLFVVIAYGQILSKELLAIPAVMPLNAHASLLPLYRGAAPINWAIINGESQTGVTIIKMTEKMDAGPVIAAETEKISGQDNALTLEKKLSLLAAALLIKTITAISRNDCCLIPQDGNQATFAHKLKKVYGLIRWNRPINEIYDLVRGLSGWPGAFTYYKKKLLKIIKADIASEPTSIQPAAPGEIISAAKSGIAAAAKDGILLIKTLQIEGKREMTAQEFIAGHKFSPGDRLG